jgi:carbamoyl-phosphate synthase large subunit
MDSIISIDSPTDQRVFAISQALHAGYSVEKLHDMTCIDRWFLYKLKHITNMQQTLQTADPAGPMFTHLLKQAKESGFSDQGISDWMGGKKTMMEIRKMRIAAGIIPAAKQIDTLAAEWPANTNYLYKTYNGNLEHDVPYEGGAVAVLGGGGYCIGNSVEFDYTAVSCIRGLKEAGERTIMINYNPETVSTDYDESDRLYFEELSVERVLDILEMENVKGVIPSVGGQIPNNLVLPLNRAGIPIMGTPPKSIDMAEDRQKFSDLMDEIGVDQPEWSTLSTLDEAFAFANKVSYPVLVRPSYVLSGAAMRVVRSAEGLEKFLDEAVAVSKEHPVVISKFIVGANEIEMDGVGKGGDVVVHAIHEHIEEAGVHSGDASLIMPPQNLTEHLRAKVEENGRKVCKALNITGPFNAQFIVSPKDGSVKIIECNVRASRSFPFVSKILGIDFIRVAVNAMLGLPIDPALANLDLAKLNFVGVKVPNFSFTRLGGADPVLGVEMVSTGEVACYGTDQYEAFLKAMLARNFKLPKKNILLMTGDMQHKDAFLPSARKLVEMGFVLHATPGTHTHLTKHGIESIAVHMDPTKRSEDEKRPDAVKLLRAKKLDLVINFITPMVSNADQTEYDRRYVIRRAAIDFACPLLNNFHVAQMLVNSLANVKKFDLRGGDEYTRPTD